MFLGEEPKEQEEHDCSCSWKQHECSSENIIKSNNNNNNNLFYLD